MHAMDTLYFDGSCDPNPGGRLGFGWVLHLNGEATPHTGRGEAAPHATNTNNVAEYRGLIAGLRAYEATGRPGPLQVIGDSQLIIGQVQGTMKTKQPTLANLCHEARAVAITIPGGVTYTWQRRAQNTVADALASADATTLPAPTGRRYAPPGALVVAPVLAAQITRLNADPAPSFKAFARLTVGGSDGYSKLALPALQTAAGPVVVASVIAAFPNDRPRQAAVLRWCLRGLAVELAIRKGEVDATIAEQRQAS